MSRNTLEWVASAFISVIMGGLFVLWVVNVPLDYELPQAQWIAVVMSSIIAASGWSTLWLFIILLICKKPEEENNEPSDIEIIDDEFVDGTSDILIGKPRK